jgi:hypothetical protein
MVCDTLPEAGVKETEEVNGPDEEVETPNPLGAVMTALAVKLDPVTEKLCATDVTPWFVEKALNAPVAVNDGGITPVKEMSSILNVTPAEDVCLKRIERVEELGIPEEMLFK